MEVVSDIGEVGKIRELPDEMLKLIIRGCSYFIILLSKNSKNSEQLLKQLDLAITEKVPSSVIIVKIGKFAMPSGIRSKIGSQRIWKFEGQNKFEELKSQYTYKNWLLSSMNKFDDLKNSYLDKVGEIVDYISK